MDQIRLPYSVEEIRSQYDERLFILLRHFISVETVQQLLATTTTIPVREVTCGDENITFGEQNFTKAHPLFQFFMRQEILTLVQCLTSANNIADLICWTSVYEIGQYIDPHRDEAGDLQIIVCLQAPTEENGGYLCVDLVDGDQNVFLTPGDTVIFKASAIQHFTTPLVETKEEASPKRIVAVGRYYL